MRRIALALALLCACRRDATHEVRTLTLPSMEPELATGPGMTEFAANCRTCHSARYVHDQPRLPRKTWTAEVEKMKNAYGAPIPKEQVARIVDYLVAVNGLGD